MGCTAPSARRDGPTRCRSAATGARIHHDGRRVRKASRRRRASDDLRKQQRCHRRLPTTKSRNHEEETRSFFVRPLRFRVSWLHFYRDHEGTKPRRRKSAFLVRPTVLRPPRGRKRAAAFLDVRLALVPEMFQRRQHRRDGGVAERAERPAADVVRNAREQIEIAHLPIAAPDALQILCSQSVPSGTACTCHTSWR